MADLASRLRDRPARLGPPWPGYEYVRGWGVFALPFDSGHVLALRVFPENDFSPYRSVWHREPEGRCSIYVDGPRLDTACPRYYGPACTHTGHVRIDIEWSGPASLRVSMDAPRLESTLTATETPILRVLNATSSRLPAWTWRYRRLVRAREVLARDILGIGDIRLSGTMPSGHVGIFMPERMYFIDETTAVLNGEDLGQNARVSPNPQIGQVPLPARGVLAIGHAAWRHSTMTRAPARREPETIRAAPRTALADARPDPLRTWTKEPHMRLIRPSTWLHRRQRRTGSASGCGTQPVTRWTPGKAQGSIVQPAHRRTAP